MGKIHVKLIWLILCAFGTQAQADSQSDFDQALNAKFKAFGHYYEELKKMKNPSDEQKSELKEKIVTPAISNYQKAEEKWIENKLTQNGLKKGTDSSDSKSLDFEEWANEVSEQHDDELKSVKKAPNSKRNPSQSLQPTYETSKFKPALVEQNEEETPDSNPQLDGGEVPKYLEFPGKKTK